MGIAQRHAAESQKSNTPTENGHNGKSRSNKPHSDIFWGVPDLVDVQEEPWAVGCQHIVWELGRVKKCVYPGTQFLIST